MAMDTITRQEEEQRPQITGKCNHWKNQFLKRTLQLVMSVALFSLFLCYTSGFSFFPHSFNVYFSTFLFSFFTRTLERKYVFLICNGILAFLAKSSVSGCSSEASVQDQEIIIVSDAKVAAEENSRGDDQRETEQPIMSGNEEERESEVPVVVQDVTKEEEEEEEEEEGFCVVTQEEHGEEAEGGLEAGSEEMASTEELNKKIEEFIRKMKEEIRIEARQQLIEAV